MSFSDILKQLSNKQNIKDAKQKKSPDIPAESEPRQEDSTLATQTAPPVPEDSMPKDSENLENAMELFETIQELIDDENESIKIPATALFSKMPKHLRGPLYNPDNANDIKIHLETQLLLEKLQSGKVSYPLQQIAMNLPSGWVVEDTDKEVELDLPTVYNSIPPELIEISSRISLVMEQVLDMPDYFTPQSSTPAPEKTTEEKAESAPAPEDMATAEEEVEKPLSDSETQRASADSSAPADQASRSAVLKPASHSPRFDAGWEGCEEVNDAVSPTDINSATLSELIRIPGVGKKRAKAILHYRSIHGDLESIYDLLSIPGIGEKNFRDMTGLDPDSRENRSAVIKRIVGLPESRTPRLSEISAAAVKALNVAGCIITGKDGIIIAQSTSVSQTPTAEYAALAPKLFRGTKKYIPCLSGKHPNMFALPGSQPPLLFVGLEHLFLILALNQDESFKSVADNAADLGNELDWLFSNRVIVAKK